MRRAEAGIQVDKFYPPTDWLDSNNQQIDIRKNAENNSIVLLVGHSADFTKYSLLGLLVDTSSGTYDVYIDDVLVGSGITKNTQYDIDFSTINTSYGSATTPESLVLHKVVVKPTTSGQTIKTFHCARTAGVSTNQEQGVLWCHFQLNNEINLNYCVCRSSYYTNIVFAVSCNGGKILTNNGQRAFYYAPNLVSIPAIEASYAGASILEILKSTPNIKRFIYIPAESDTGSNYGCFENSQKLEQINFFYKTNRIYGRFFVDTFSLKVLPKFEIESGNGTLSIIESINLYPTKINLTNNKDIKRLEFRGSSTYPMRGLRGLKVSNEAPFTDTSPQINVNYTGLDRDALRELFTSLPYNVGYEVVGSPTIVDGIMTNISSGNGVRLSKKIDNDWNILEISTEVALSNLGSGNFGAFFGNSYYFLLREQDYKFCIFYRKTTTDAWKTKFIDYVISENTLYKITLLINQTTGLFVLILSQNDTILSSIEFTDIENIPNFVNRDEFGKLLGNFTVEQINLKNTYIKKDSIYWFRGQAQTTKTLSLVGATGTADLTQADKDIALNKGWSLTLS